MQNYNVKHTSITIFKLYTYVPYTYRKQKSTVKGLYKKEEKAQTRCY